MPEVLPASHWRDDLDIARSAPLAAMRRFAVGRAVTVVGPLAEELIEELGVEAVASATLPVSPRPVPGKGVGRAPGRVLIILDAAIARWLVENPRQMSDLLIAYPEGVLLPFRLQAVSCSPIWGHGFSWIEHNGENAWIWCEAPGAAMAHLGLHNTTNEPLAVAIEFEAGCIYDDAIEVTAAIDGVDVDTARSGQWRSLPFTLPPGRTNLAWRSPARPLRLPGSDRALSFLIKNFRLQREDGTAILSVAQAYELATPENDPLAQEVVLRRHLHAAGGVSIAGMMRSGTSAFRHRALPLTMGSPDYAAPWDAKARGFYGGIETFAGDIAWLLVSAVAGPTHERQAAEIVHAC